MFKILAVVGLILFSQWALWRWENRSGLQNQTEKPTNQIQFSLRDPLGNSVDARGLIGKPYLLNFWASWCGPCVEEMPGFIEFAKKLRQQNILVIAISADESWDDVVLFFKKYRFKGVSEIAQFPGTILLDPPGAVAAQIGSGKYPETYIVDARGQVQQKYIGVQPWGDPKFQRGVIDNIGQN